ncbi:hypothetical protein SCLCIDRAFT_526566 [Scleroderma citrinum Foug A]|uniref:Uncharacterized protein n=1 Tax=Scleroderma citrinum Foug A TaxID=1036808 RepID=A0A0C3AZD2_9AGAM|nr:hypothetical protein SCLCIDRAFT_526566 [Scleroderma citrinum Foug A]
MNQNWRHCARRGYFPPSPSSRESATRKAPRDISYLRRMRQMRLLETQRSPSAAERAEAAASSADREDLGWKTVDSVKSRRRRKRSQATEDTSGGLTEEETQENIKHRGHLLKELAARMTRDTQLLYALRELELQRQMVGKGGRRKIRGVEAIDADEDGNDSNDEERRTTKKRADKTYKPRIYKWRIERKR